MLSTGRRAVRCVVLAVLALALALALAPRAASAGDTWTSPFPGVRHLHRVTSAPLNIHALVVDLCAAGIAPRATRPAQRRQTVSSFGHLIGAQAAVNGDFFSYDTYKTTGLSIGKGERWTDTSDPNFEGFVAFGYDAADFSPPSKVVSSPPDWMRNVVSGRPQVVKDGAVITEYNCSSPGGYCVRDPRTGVGLSQDRKTLYLAVVDGRNPGLSRGMTSAELGAFMKGLGAYDALSLDSGGSTEMWLSGSGVLNHPSDGSERVVANHLAIFAGGTSEPLSCVDNAAPPDGGGGDGADAGPGSPVDAGVPSGGEDAATGEGASGGGDVGVGCSLASRSSRASAGGALIALLALLLAFRRLGSSTTRTGKPNRFFPRFGFRFRRQLAR